MSIFSKISQKKIQKSNFDLSHEVKLTCNSGYMIPVLNQEILPGDSFSVNSEIFLRAQPMLAPLMHRVNVYCHYFFVPNRLIYNDWENFIVGNKDDNGNEYIPPNIAYKDISNLNGRDYTQTGFLADHLGLPAKSPAGKLNIPDNLLVSLMHFNAYNLIFNEYYRDQNLTPERKIYADSGTYLQSQLNEIDFMLAKRAWEKDYFTACLPWPQKGDDVFIPLSGNAPINRIDESKPDTYQGVLDMVTGLPINPPDTTIGGSGQNAGMLSLPTQPGGVLVSTTSSGQQNVAAQMQLDNLEVSLNQVNATTINELRKAVKLQEWFERNARGGTRYIEQILSHFGEQSSDSRLQRPEYLGGGKNPIVISEVLSKAEGNDTVVAEMFGKGVSVGKTNSFNRKFEEHGVVIGILTVIPRTAYSQGINKKFLRLDKFDFYFPEFANLGEQEVINNELYMDDDGLGNETFGYIPRFSEYKYSNSEVHGDMRDTLAFWHWSRIFNARPALNQEFIECNQDNRIFSVTSSGGYPVDNFIIQIYHNIKARRPMPYFSTPSLF